MSVITGHAASVHAPAAEVMVRWDDVNYTDESSRVISADGIESMDDLALPHAREATVVLDNDDGRYTPGNTSSPIYAWTTVMGRRVTLRFGYDTATTGGWAQVGTYVLRALDISADERTATLRLMDLMDDYAERLVSLTPTANLALGTAASLLLASAGLGTAEYSLDTLAGTAAYGYVSSGKLVEELWQVAIAEGGRVYLDETGILKMQSRVNRLAALRSPVASLTASAVAYKSAARRRSDQPNRLSLNFEDRATATLPEPVFSISSAIEVQAAVNTTYWALKPIYIGHWEGTVWVPGSAIPSNPLEAYDQITTFYPGQLQLTIRPQDQTQWKSNIPADFSSATFDIVANTQANGSGVAVTVESIADPSGRPTAAGTVLDYWWSANGTVVNGLVPMPPATLIFYNSRTSPTYVTTLDISAKPARAASGYVIVTTDEQALAENGGRVVDRQVASAYLQSQGSAVARAQELMALLTASRVALDIPDIDGAPFLRPGDAFDYVDDTVTPAATYRLQVLENRWTYRTDGGYTAALVTMPALSSADLDATVAVPPVTASGTATSRTGPFTWGADANQLYWGEGEWS